MQASSILMSTGDAWLQHLLIQPGEDIPYLTHTLKNKVRHTHEKYDTLTASATHFRGQRHIRVESDTQGGSPTL